MQVNGLLNQDFMHLCYANVFDRFGESQGSFCQLAVVKDDGNLENQAHTVNIEDLVQQQQRRFNMNFNITTTRTSANKLKALAMKNAVNQQAHFKPSYHQYSKYQHNMMNNNQYQNGYSSRPFHKAHHKNRYHGNAMVNNSVGYQGKRGSGDFNGGSGNFSGGFNSQSKDRYHWVRSTEHSPVDQQESMRLSPN